MGRSRRQRDSSQPPRPDDAVTPMKDAAPDTAVDTAQCTGTVVWQNADGTAFSGSVFMASTIYSAILTLTALKRDSPSLAWRRTDSGAVTVTNSLTAGM